MIATCVSQNQFSLAPEAFGLHSAFCRTVAHWGKRIFNGATMRKQTNLNGLRFGRLTAIQPAGKSLKGELLYDCICECGIRKIFFVGNLRSGKSKSCGCNGSRTTLAQRATTHNKSKTPEYNVWNCMRQRCNNTRNSRYCDYGGRGIKICERWMESFINFLNDMGTRPSPYHTLDRINNNGNYEPSNCRWTIWAVQANNMRSNRVLTLFGKSDTATRWARKIGLNPQRVLARKLRGWSDEKSLLTPV